MLKKSGFALFLVLSGCGSAKGLIGVWELNRQECLFKDGSGKFKDSFEESAKYTLEFKNEGQVILSYKNKKVDLKSENKTVKCDVLFTGAYSYSGFSGALTFDFTDEETGKHRISKGESCETKSEIHFKEPSAPHEHYEGDPSIGLQKVTNSELRLSFPGAPKCVNNKLIITFNKK